MTLIRICAALAVVVSAWSFSGQARSQTNQSNIEAADQLFKAGQFDKAREVYSRLSNNNNPNDYSTVLQLGRIALLSNQLEDAQKWLQQALHLRPDDADAKVMLAEAFYRRDDFQQAAAALNGVDVSTNKLIIEQYPTLNVAKLASFKGQTPYELHGEGQATRLKFIRSDPLPPVNVRVNGGEEVTFFIVLEDQRSRSIRSSPRSSACRSSGTCRALFPAASIRKLGSRASNHSRSATGL
jgi:tetratricopeptide (TPR) repeat protein